MEFLDWVKDQKRNFESKMTDCRVKGDEKGVKWYQQKINEVAIVEGVYGIYLQKGKNQ